MRGVVALIVLGALLSGCTTPGQPVPAVATAGELLQPAPALELPSHPPVQEPLEPWRSLRVQNVLLADATEEGWIRVQFELETTGWRKPLALEGRTLHLDVEGDTHDARLGWDGGFHAYPVPDGWGHGDAPRYDNTSRTVPSGGWAMVSWTLPVPLAEGQAFTIRMGPADFHATVPADPEHAGRPLGAILGGDAHFSPFMSPVTEFWWFEEVVAHRDGDQVTRLEIRFTADMEQDLSDAWIGVQSGVEPGTAMDAAHWFVPDASPPGQYVIATSNDTDRSLQQDPAWITPGDRIHAFLDLDAAGVDVFLGERIALDLGPEPQPRLDRFVPMESEWEGKDSRVLYEATEPGPAEGEAGGGGGQG